MRSGLVSIALFLAAFGVANASDITVTRLDDPTPSACLPTDCSLREAIIIANSLPGADRILLPSGVLQLTIANTTPDAGAAQGDLDVTEDLEIVGVTAASTSILALISDRIFNLNPGARLTLRQLTLGGGHASGGGAILDNGNGLTIEDAVIGNNVSTNDGGAIRSSSGADMVLRRVTFQNNTATDNGGAINGGSGDVVLVDSTLTGNKAANGGGVYSYGTRVYRSVFEGNQALSGYGGAIFGVADCSCTAIEVHESTFSGNSAHSGGGAIYTPPMMTAELSTFSGNSSASGGAIYADTTHGASSGDGFHIYSSTFYLNTATSGSAIAFDNNSAGLGAPPDFQNTIISGTCVQTGGGAGTFSGSLGNIESPGNTCHLTAPSQHNVAAANLLLGPLGDNGGPTQTHLPQAGSVAINAGSNSVCTTFDQRDYVRIDGACDSGSVEAGALGDVIFRDGFDI